MSMVHDPRANRVRDAAGHAVALGRLRAGRAAAPGRVERAVERGGVPPVPGSGELAADQRPGREPRDGRRSRERAFEASPPRRRRGRAASRGCRRRLSTPGGRRPRGGPAPNPTSRCFRVIARVSSGPEPRRSSNSRFRQMNRGPTKVMSAKAGAPPAAGIEMSTCRSPRAVSSASHPPGQLVGLQIGARRQREPIGALERKAHVRMDAPLGCIQLQLLHAGAARREVRAAAAQRQRGAAGFPAHDGGGASHQLASQITGRSAGRQQVDAKAFGVGPKARVAVVVDHRDVRAGAGRQRPEGCEAGCLACCASRPRESWTTAPSLARV